MTLTPFGFRTILEDVKYKDWTFEVVGLGGGRWKVDGSGDPYYEEPVGLRVRFRTLAEVRDGVARYEEQKGRKWYLSPHMTKSEVVLTALLAALQAEEHEAREAFRYKGKRVAGPHIDVDFLADNVGLLDNLDIREGDR